jgi:hypothetical protein
VTAISLIEHGEISDEKCQPTFFVEFSFQFDQRNRRHGLGRYFSSGLGRYFCHVFFDAATPPPGIFGAATPPGADIFCERFMSCHGGLVAHNIDYE